MATEIELEDTELDEAEDEAEAEHDETEEYEDTEDVESFAGLPGAFLTPLTAPAPIGVGRSTGALIPGREDRRRMRGVRAALIRGAGGATAIVRLPTAVATMRGVRRLHQRNARAEAVLAQHEGRLRAMRSRESRIRTSITGGLVLQHLRDVVAEARNSVAPAQWPAVMNPILAGTDYTLAAAQTGFSVAAIPANRRSAIFWTLPLTTGLVFSLGREILRYPVGLGLPARAGAAGPPVVVARPAKPFWRASAPAVAIPTLVGAVASYLVRPRRARRYVRL